MHLSLAFAAALIPVLSVSAAEILIQVGANGRLQFSPPNITANLGDIVSFQFQNKNHSVTQSTFANPCQRPPIQASTLESHDSGFYPISPNVTVFPQWLLAIHTLDPLWFFCAQTDPVSHCEQGMVFSINAVENGPENFATFQIHAMGGIDVASNAANATTSTSAISISPTSSTYTSPTSTSPVAAKGKNLAGPIAGGVVGGLGLLVVLGFLVYWIRRRRQNCAFGRIDSIEEPPHDKYFNIGPVVIHPGTQQEIPELREQAEVRRPAESTPENSTGQPDGTGTQLLDTLRMLSTQMHGLEQQIQAIGQVREEELPQYTPRPPP